MNTKQFSMSPKTRYILLAVMGTLALAITVMIFAFSSESKAESGERSHGVTETVAEILIPGFSDMTPDEQTEIVNTLHRPVRKIAHFSEFCLLGMLACALMYIIGKGKYLLWWIVPTVTCLFLATADEVYQIFTGRGSSATDVIIDFSGSVVGICLVHLLFYVIARRKAKKQCAKENTP